MALTLAQMGLKIWDQPGDFFSHTQLVDNWEAIDVHDHTTGKGIQIPTGGIVDGAITAAKLASDSVTNIKIANDAVSTAEILDNSITNAKMADDSVGSNEIINGSITTAELSGTAGITAGQLATQAKAGLFTDTGTSVLLGSSETLVPNLSTSVVAAVPVFYIAHATVQITEGASGDGSVTMVIRQNGLAVGQGGYFVFQYGAASETHSVDFIASGSLAAGTHPFTLAGTESGTGSATVQTASQLTVMTFPQ